MPIKDLPLQMNPREKVLLEGMESLTDIELLALFIRSGSRKEDVLALAKRVIKKYGSLSLLKFATISELQSIEGIGPVKAIELKGLFEFAERLKQIDKFDKIENIKQARQFAIKYMALKNNEEFFVIFLNEYNEVIRFKLLYRGTQNNVNVDPKDIISLALKVDANKFYCFHNHPSGVVTPSSADKLMTKRLHNYSDLFGICMVAHIIINSKGDYLSIGK